MYKIPKPVRTTIETNQSVEGETIEIKIERLLSNKDEKAETKELIYTKKEDGVQAAYNIRHDHWDDAYENASEIAEKHKELDASKLEKRKKIMNEEKEKREFLDKQAKEGLQAKNNPQPPSQGEV